jgi:dodecin
MALHHASTGVVKVVEVVGTSPTSWSDAARRAVEVASETIDHIVGVDVLHSTASVQAGKIVEYRVDVKLAFVVEREHED